MRRTLLSLICVGVSLLSAAPAFGVGRDRAPRPLRCNGFAYLCDRRLDQVVFAGTHNSMASTVAGFADPAQGRSIRQQLDSGIRALLIDVYQGTPTTAKVCTDPTPLKVQQVTQDLGPQAVDALIALRNATCPPAGGPTSALYLCHDFCEAGATKFANTLHDLRAFLVAHPGAVLMVILEDYVAAPAIDAATKAAHLQRFLFAKKLRAPWPTLRKMVTTGKRLVMFSENQGGSPHWLFPAFREMQDTPFAFLTTQEFSCAANRGPPTARLFLLNHWLSTPDNAATASTVNAEPALVARAQQCANERGKIPNIIAVDFAESGGLIPAVDALNRASRGRK